MSRQFKGPITLSCLAILTGCAQQSTPAPRGSVDPAREIASDSAPSAARTAGARQEQIQSLVRRSLKPPTSEQSAAYALDISEKSTSELGHLLESIEAAQAVVLFNLQNADTIGFKRSTAHNTGAAGGLVIQLDMTQGSLESTGRDLDIAIQGSGFFRVKVADGRGNGTAYTRNGNVFVNYNGELIVGTGDGYKLLPTIALPKGITSVSISPDGIVSGIKPGADAPSAIGQIKLAQFVNPEGLQLCTNGLLAETQTSGAPIITRPGDQGSGQLLQSFLEASNVNIVTEDLRLRFLSNWRAQIRNAIGQRD